MKPDSQRPEIQTSSSTPSRTPKPSEGFPSVPPELWSASLRRRDVLRQAATLGLLSFTGLGSFACRDTGESADATAGTDTAAGNSSEFSSYDGMGLAELVAKGEVTPLELVEDTLRRVDAVNPKLNAVLTSLFDTEKARVRAGGPLGEGPLSGVPVMIKNLIGYDEATIDSGSRLIQAAIKAGQNPDQGTSPLVQAMEDTGMIITGITSTPEFGLIDVTEPVLHGPTRNPWDTNKTPGGSSGGSGSAVAAGIVPIGHANDGGGSIRLPASHCGLVGLKPTRGRELGSETGPTALANDLCVSRTVRDTAAFLSVVENPNPEGLTPVGMVEGPSSERRKIALLIESTGGSVDPQCEHGVRMTAEKLTELGHSVEEIALPYDGARVIEVFINFWAAGAVGLVGMAQSLAGEDGSVEDLLEPWTLGLAELAQSVGVDKCVADAQQLFPELAAAHAQLFQTYDLILSPVLAVPPFDVGHHSPSGDFDVIMERVVEAVGYTPIHNAVGTPAISLPLSQTEDGLPIGNQFAASIGNERLLLEIAYELEDAMPWKGRRPAVWA